MLKLQTSIKNGLANAGRQDQTERRPILEGSLLQIIVFDIRLTSRYSTQLVWLVAACICLLVDLCA